MCNVTFHFTNSTFGGSWNGTVNFANNTQLNLSYLIASATVSENVYGYRIQCRDNLQTQNTANTTTRTITVDYSIPMINITFLDIADNEQTQFGLNAEITTVCNRGDKTAGVNDTKIFLRNPNEGSFSLKKLDVATVEASTSLTGTEFVIPSSETEQLGVYTVNCTVIDRAGNLYQTTKTFEIVPQAPLGGSAFGIPGFSAPVGKTKINSGVTSDGGKLGPDGISRLMQAGASLKLDIKGQDHTVTIVTITDDSVTLRISSEPLTVTVGKGETTDVDIDRDGTNDLGVTYHKRFPPGGKHADLTFTLVESPAVATTPGTSEESAEEQAAREAMKASKSGLIVTLIVIVVIIVLGYFMLSKRKK